MTDRVSSYRPRRVFWVVLVSALVVELAWMLAVPAFRGMDEVDHAFRADSLVHGQLLSRETPEKGRGELVVVSEDLARAARPVCEAYRYTLRDNCNPVAEVGSGRVSIASAAADYNPAWYAVAGTVARPIDGTGALMAMRLPGALGFALLLAWAGSLLSRHGDDGRTLLGLLLVATPITAYSAVTAAPNAVGIGGGILLWSAVVALLRRPDRPPLAALVVAVVLVAHSHTTGVVWLAVATLSLLVVRPPRWWATWIHEDLARRSLALAAAVISAAAAVMWIRWAGTNGLNQPRSGAGLPDPFRLLGQQLVWLCQSVGAFPNRNDAAPPLAYLLWFVPLAAVVLAGVRAADQATRRALGLLTAAWVAVPVCLTLVSYRSEGFAWQGRYALPLAAGIVLLCAAAASTGAPPRWPWVPITVFATAVAHALCVVAMVRRTVGEGTSFSAAAELPGGLWIIGTLALAGGLLPLVLGRVRRRTTPIPVAPPTTIGSMP